MYREPMDGNDLHLIGAPEPEPRLPYIWTVYPSISSRDLVAVGSSRSEQQARQLVEEVLTAEDSACVGVVTAPGGRHDVCRRTNTGGYHWAPLYPHPQPAREPLFPELAP